MIGIDTNVLLRYFLADDRNPHGLNLFLDKGVKFLNYIEFVNFGGKSANKIVREWVNHAKL